MLFSKKYFQVKGFKEAFIKCIKGNFVKKYFKDIAKENFMEAGMSKKDMIAALELIEEEVNIAAKNYNEKVSANDYRYSNLQDHICKKLKEEGEQYPYDNARKKVDAIKKRDAFFKKLDKIPVKTRLLNRRAEQLEEIVYDVIGTPAHTDSCKAYPCEELEIGINTRSDGRYSSRCTYTLWRYYLTLGIPSKRIIDGNDKNAWMDGIRNIYCDTRTIGNTKLHQATWITKNKGFNFYLNKGFIAEQTFQCKRYFYHADTKKEALEGLKRKLKVAIRKAAPITPDSYITRSDYRRITGACEAGVNAFCEKHNLQDISKIKVADLLPLLKGEYGEQKLLEAIQK